MKSRLIIIALFIGLNALALSSDGSPVYLYSTPIGEFGMYPLNSNSCAILVLGAELRIPFPQPKVMAGVKVSAVLLVIFIISLCIVFNHLRTRQIEKVT